jgi:hypothetical protein
MAQLGFRPASSKRGKSADFTGTGSGMLPIETSADHAPKNMVYCWVEPNRPTRKVKPRARKSQAQKAHPGQNPLLFCFFGLKLT